MNGEADNSRFVSMYIYMYLEFNELSEGQGGYEGGRVGMKRDRWV